MDAALALPHLSEHGVPRGQRAQYLAHLLFTQGCKVFALLDAARDSGVVPLLENGDCEYACLYKGQAAKTYRHYAPYLVQLDAGSRVLDSLLTRAWGHSAGYFLGTRSRNEDLYDHLRKFLFVTLPSGKSAYFRFYDPRVIRGFLPTCTVTQIESLWSHHIQWLLVEDADPAHAQVFTFEPTGPKTVHGATQATLVKERIGLDEWSDSNTEDIFRANRSATV